MVAVDWWKHGLPGLCVGGVRIGASGRRGGFGVVGWWVLVGVELTQVFLR